MLLTVSDQPEGGTIAVGTERRRKGESAWVYDVSTIALPAAEGRVTIAAEFCDAAGNQSPIVTDVITVDRTAPGSASGSAGAWLRTACNVSPRDRQSP